MQVFQMPPIICTYTGKHLDIHGHEGTLIADKLHVSFFYTRQWIGTNICNTPNNTFYQIMY